jgi:hypothetical protein
VGRSGPPLRPDSASIAALGTDALSEPIVATIPRAAGMLRLDPSRLQAAVAAAGVPTWGAHADGSPVYRWPELVAAVRDHLGMPIPATRPTLREHQTKQAVRRQRNQQQRKRKS